MPVSSSEWEEGEAMVNKTHISSNQNDDEIQQTKDMLAELGVIHDRNISNASCLSEAEEEATMTTAEQAETGTEGDDDKHHDDNDDLVDTCNKTCEIPEDVQDKLVKVDNLVEKQTITGMVRLGVPAQNHPLEEEAPGTDKDVNIGTMVADMPRTSLTRNVGARQQSEPGAIAVQVSGLVNTNSEATGTSRDSGTGEGARNNIPNDDPLVSAHLVLDHSQSNSNRNDEEAAYVLPVQVATVADSFCGNSRKYRYFMVAAIAVILALVGVVVATTVPSSSSSSSSPSVEGSTGGTQSTTTDGLDPNDGNDEATALPQAPPMIQQYGQTIIGSVSGDRFGAPLVWNHAGNILAIGARLNGDVGEDSGMVRVYQAKTIVSEEANGSSSRRTLWEQYGNAIFGQSPGDEFAHSGMAMSADGKRLAVGAPYRNVTVHGNATTDETTMVMNAAGVVRVFDYVAADGNSGQALWRESGPPMEGFQGGDLFGRAVAMSDDGTIVACSSYESSENGFASGNIRVFRQRQSNSNNSTGVDEPTGWDPMGQVLIGKTELDRLGRALDMSADGMRIVAGATQFKGEGYKPGYVQVYGFNNVTNRWDQIGQDIVGDTDQGVFGRDVALSADGTIIACGSNLANTSGLEDSGLARMYQLRVDSNNTQQWMPLGQPILGTAGGDGLGVTVALSANGKRVAIGAQQKKTNGGYVLVMDYDEASQRWKPNDQNSTDILKGAEELDKFGSEVQLSASGQLLAIGAIGGDLNGDDSGQVQVFNLTNI